MSEAENLVASVRKAFRNGTTRDMQWRLKQLDAMLNMLEENGDLFKKAVEEDLRKPSFEADLMEIMVLKNEIHHTKRNLSTWIKPEYPSTTLAQKFDTIRFDKEPYGVTLVIGAWNYPINLLLLPVVGAIAAGNCCVIKPSEISQSTAALMKKLVPQYLDKDCFPVYCGGIPETTELLKQRFDYIFFTGSTNVGKVVMRAASEYLTPVTLELGGKSPCYIDDGCDINLVAKRMLWGKMTNLGQTCIAPDYLICHKNVQDKFIKELQKVLVSFYGEDPQKSKDLGRIVNERNFNRLVGLMDKMPKSKLAFGGKTDIDDKYIELTCYTDVSMEDSIMGEELFGPILPVVTAQDYHHAVEMINNSGEKPLAIYVFSNNNKAVEKFVSETSSGGILANDTLMQCSASNVHFGGVGNSGMGSYHGKSTFDTFTHKKPVWLRKQNMEAVIAGRYPPFNQTNLNRLAMLTSEKSFCNIL